MCDDNKGVGRSVRSMWCSLHSQVLGVVEAFDGDVPAPPTIEESDRCVLKDNLVSLLHVHGLVGDLLPQGGDVLSFDRRLEELGQVLDGPFQISAQ